MLVSIKKCDLSLDIIDEKNTRTYTTSTGARVDNATALQTVNMYCSTLPKDMFTELKPLWYYNRAKGTCLVKLPSNAGIRSSVEGPHGLNKKGSAQAAALEVVIQLHKNGVLDDFLNPVKIEKPIYWLNMLESSEEQSSEEFSNNFEIFQTRVPIFLQDCRPLPYRQCYLHIIWTQPEYDIPSIPRQIFCHKLMESNLHNFGILTGKPWPTTMCEFPVYSDLGQVRVTVETNTQVLYFNELHLNEISEFHRTLFLNVMAVVRKCFVYDIKGDSNGYFVVPLKMNEKTKKTELNWKCIRRKFPKEISRPTDEEIINQEHTAKNYVGKVVTPWYNPRIPYIVTEVSEHVFLYSDFVCKKYHSYADYYLQKHNLTSKKPEQALLLVRPITSALDGIKPRPITISEKTRRKTKKDTDTYLVAEFCFTYAFPSVYWYKSILLPSVLHRIEYLLLGEDLRQQFVNEAQIGSLKLPKGNNKDTVKHFKEIDERNESKTCVPTQHKVRKRVSTRICNLLYPKRGKMDSKTEILKNSEHQEHYVIVRDFEKYAKYIDSVLVDEHKMTLQNKRKYGEYLDMALVSFLKAQSTNTDESFSPLFSRVSRLVPRRTRVINFERSPELQTLTEDEIEYGPKPHQILEALTLRDAQDVFSLERLETLGDSCFKYLVSINLYLENDDLNEGQLTILKGELISNKNLFYCGTKLNIGSYVKASNFSTKIFWCPPGFKMPPEFLELLKKNHPLATVLAFDVPDHEQFSGLVNVKTITINNTAPIALNETGNSNNGNKEVDFLLGQHKLLRKNISDVIEALLGVYVQNTGIKGAIKLLKYFGILPQETPVNLCDLLRNVPVSNMDYLMYALPNYEDIERLFDYKFKNKAYLLEAFTHPSYTSSSACYQRLEFIGDAILDFLITSYIYEYSGNHLDPGQLTDLRSALVNNNTFGALSVRLGLHENLLCQSQSLVEAIKSFVHYQEAKNHEIHGNELMTFISEKDVIIAEEVEVPKALGDIFESVAGAIYMDSKCDLSAVWRVYYNIMKKEIDEFSKNIPINPVRTLYEKKSLELVFSTYVTFGHIEYILASKVDDSTSKTIVSLKVTGADKLTRQYFGRGENTKAAKRAAAKFALQNLKNDSFII